MLALQPLSGLSEVVVVVAVWKGDLVTKNPRNDLIYRKMLERDLLYRKIHLVKRRLCPCVHVLCDSLYVSGIIR
jgi:hypothetical protein